MPKGDSTDIQSMDIKRRIKDYAVLECKQCFDQQESEIKNQQRLVNWIAGDWLH